MPSQVLDLFYVQTDLKQSGNIGMTKDMGSYMTVRQLVLNQSPETPVRTCLKSSNEDGNECKIENQSRNKEFALTIFPKSAEFVEPAEKTLYHPAARQHNKLV